MTRLLGGCIVLVCIVIFAVGSGCTKRSRGSSAASAAKTFLYLPSYNGDVISGYELNTSTGALTELTNSPFAAQDGPLATCVSPSKNFLFVTNYDESSISVFSVATDGALSEVAGSPFSSHVQPYRCTITPDGAFLYIIHGSGATTQLSGWSVNSSTGALTQVPGSPYTTDGSGRAITTTADGAYVYTTFGNGNLRAFSVNSSDGSLAVVPGSPFNTGLRSDGLLVNPVNGLLYSIQWSGGQITRYTIASLDGSLSGAVVNNFGSQLYNDGCFTPNGNFFYLVDDDDTISRVQVGVGGALTHLGSVTLAANTGPSNCQVTANGSFLYAGADYSNQILGYSIDSSGALTALTGFPLDPGTTGPGLVAIVAK